jgi:hypothetical protein
MQLSWIIAAFEIEGEIKALLRRLKASENLKLSISLRFYVKERRIFSPKLPTKINHF